MFQYDSTQITMMDEWHHVAGTYNGSQMKIYVDGVLENTCDAGTLVSQDDSTPITIGTYRQGSSNYQFNGLINKLSIWNDELCLSDLQEDIASFSLSKRICFGRILEL